MKEFNISKTNMESSLYSKRIYIAYSIVSNMLQVVVIATSNHTHTL